MNKTYSKALSYTIHLESPENKVAKLRENFLSAKEAYIKRKRTSLCPSSEVLYRTISYLFTTNFFVCFSPFTDKV